MSSLRILVGFLLLAVASGTLAQGRAIEDVRISKQGTVATVEIRFPCAVRYLSHSPQVAGVSFRIRVALEEGCQMEIGRGIRSDGVKVPKGDGRRIRVDGVKVPQSRRSPNPNLNGKSAQRRDSEGAVMSCF